MTCNNSTIFRRVTLKYKKTFLFVLVVLGFCFISILPAEEDSTTKPEKRSQEPSQTVPSSDHEDLDDEGRSQEDPTDPDAPTTDSGDPNQPAEVLEAINLNNIEMKNIIQKIADFSVILPLPDALFLFINSIVRKMFRYSRYSSIQRARMSSLSCRTPTRSVP